MKECVSCHSNTTYIDPQHHTERWYKCKDKDGFFCRKCYTKIIANPKRTKEYIKKYNDRRSPEDMRKYSKEYSKRIDPIIKKKINAMYHARLLRFKDKQISLEENPRKGKCLKCEKSIGDKYINYDGQIAIIKTTHMHHIEYHDDDPLKDTMELCASCHAKERKNI